MIWVVIKDFMAAMTNHGYSYSSSVGTQMLDSAVQASSKYGGIQEVINAMKADQIKAEKEAVEEVLGNSYAGKTISEVSSSILNADAKDYDTDNKGNAYYNAYNDSRSTVENLIKERKAYIFLEKYCGVLLTKKHWIRSTGSVTSWSNVTTGNVDTGAITGADANITLKAGDVVNGKTLTAADLQTLAKQDGTSLSGDTLIIGTGTEKTDRSVVPEAFVNTYVASTSAAQVINTGSRDWVVQATGYDDTVNSGGADSISSGAGNDQINVNANGATVTSGSGSDNISISAQVKDVTITDLNYSDEITISGTFQVGSAQIEDTLLVITDKTGTRKIRLGDLDTAKNGRINGTTIANLLSNAGIDINNLKQTSYVKENGIVSYSGQSGSNVTNTDNFSGEDGSGRTAIDPDYKPSPVVEKEPVVKQTEEHDAPNANTGNTNSIVTVNLDNVDTSTAGDVSVGGAKVGALSSTYPNASTFTRNGLTIHLLGEITDSAVQKNISEGKDSYNPSKITLRTFDELTTDQKTLIAALFKWWAKECLKLNEESYDIGFNSDTASVKDIGLYFYDDKGHDNILAAVWHWWNGNGIATKLMLSINLNYYNNIDVTDVDGTSANGGLLDRTLAHEFTHADMAANIVHFNRLPKFIKEGMAELTHGIDDERTGTIFDIAYKDDWLDASLDLNNTGTGSQNIGDGYAGGFMFLRYFARQAALQSVVDDLSKVITLTEGDDTRNNTLEGATIVALGGNDSIYNSGTNVSINGGAGIDTLYNMQGASVTMSGGDDDDELHNNSGNYFVMDGGSGNDYFNNYKGQHGVIFGGDDDDSINNQGSNVTISGGAGDDTVWNWNASVSIAGNDGTDTLWSNGDNVTLNGGKGNDSLYNRGGSNVLFQYQTGGGNDTIWGFNETSTLQIGDGTGTYSKETVDNNIIVTVGEGSITLTSATTLSNPNIAGTEVITVNPLNIVGTEDADTINNSLDGATINALGGADSITNSGASVLIDGGDANDYIYTSGANVTIKGGEGADTINNRVWTSNASIDGGAGDDYIENNGYNSTVDGSDGDDYIDNWGNDSTLLGGNGDDTIINNSYGSGGFLDGGTGNDLIKNGTFHNVTIDAGEGDDTIQNEGANVSINAGNGNDDIANYIYYGVTINAGADNDTVTNTGASVSVDAGTGDDFISNSGSDVTIKSGKGNDTLDGVGSEIILFGTGDGSDVINNWQNKNLISLTSGTILNTLLSGEDIILSLGSDSLTLKNAKNKLVRVNNVDGTQTILNEERIGQTISNDLSNQTLAGGLGNDSIYNTGNNVTIKSSEGDDSVTNRGANVLIEGNADSDNIKNSKFIEYNYNTGQWTTSSISPDNVTILGGEDNDRIFNYGGQRISIDGNAGDDYIENNEEPYVYKPESLEDDDYEDAEIVYPTPDYATLLGGDGNDTIINSGASSIIDGGDGKDDIENYGDYSTINAGIGDDDIYNGSGNNALIDGGDGSDYIRNFGDNSTVNGGKDADTLANNSNNYSGGYSNVLLNGDEGNDFLENRNSLNISLNGGLGNDTIENYGGASALINGDAGDDVISNKTGFAGYDYILSDNVTIDAGKGNDTITNEGNNVLFIYSGGNDSIVGFSATSTLQIGDGTATYSKEALNGDIIVTVGDGKITLTGAASLSSSLNIAGKEVSDNQWRLVGTTATYGTADNTLITVSGVKSLSGISLNNKVVTISAASLGTSKITISNGYTLALGKDATVPKTVEASYNANTQTYTGAGKTAGYTLSNNAISYSASTAPTFKFSGIADSALTKGFYVSTSKKTIAIGASAINSDKTIPVKLISAPAGYKMELGSSLPKPVTISANTYDAKTMTYKTKGTTAGYTLSDDGKTISYTAGTSLEFKFNGVADDAIIKGFFVNASKKTIAIGASAINPDKTIPVKLLSAPAGYKMELGSSLPKATTISANTYDAKTMTYKTKGTTGSYKLSSDGKTISYLEGTSLEFKFNGVADGALTKGFYVNSSKKTIAIGASAVNSDKTIPVKLISAPAGYKMELGFSLPKASTGGTSTLEDGFYTVAGQTAGYTLSSDAKTIAYHEALDNALELSGVATEPTTPTNGTVTLKPANFDKSLAVVSNAGEYAFALAKGTYTGKTFIGSANADTITSAGANLTINAGKGDDDITNSGAGAKINAGAGNDKITNDGANVTLTGGAGADTLWGDDYNETFVYASGDGNDVIVNFGEDDLLQITGTFTTAYDSAAGTIKFTVGTGSITLTDFTTTTFNVNGDSYVISGKQLVKK